VSNCNAAHGSSTSVVEVTKASEIWCLRHLDFYSSAVQINKTSKKQKVPADVSAADARM
jgi:hypothetical protein